MTPGDSGTFRFVEEGLRLCRAGEWKRGLPLLSGAVENRAAGDRIPGLVYSYLGYGMARFEKRAREGLKLCEHALKVQYYESDNHWNLARVHVLLRERRLAVSVIERGLKLDPDHKGLLDLQKEIGRRRQPVLGFLARNHPVNVFLGRLRHSMNAQKS